MESKSTFSFITNNFEYAELGMKAGKEYHVKGYISTDEIDRANEVVTKECMADMVTQIKAGNVKLDIEHSTFTGENDIPVGRIIDAGIDAKGLWVEAIINKSHSKFDSVWKSIKDGFLDAFSIAYKVKSAVKDIINGVQVTLLKNLELLNVAITGNPVNKGARMTESFYKSMNTVLLKDVEEENKMSEEVKVDEVVVPEEPKVEEPIVPEEVKVEEPVVPEEPKINPLDQIKSMQEEIAEMKKVNAELKAVREELAKLKSDVSKPQMKGIANTNIGEMKTVEVEVKTPLQYL